MPHQTFKLEVTHAGHLGLPACLVAVMLCACAPAPVAPERPAPGSISFEIFEAADSDHSGKLSAQEATAMPFVSRHFGAIDADSDTQVSWTETRNYMIAGPVRPLEELRPRRRAPDGDRGY